VPYNGGGSNNGSETPVLTSAQKQQIEQDYYDAYYPYTLLKSAYDRLIDGGNTNATLAEIDAATPADMWRLRSQLLGASPFVSQEVLFAAAERDDVFTESVLFEILLSNPDELKKDLVKAYLEKLKEYKPDLDETEFYNNLRLFVLFRTLQVLGAYGFRGYFEKKPDFMKNSIVPAVANLRRLVIDKPFTQYPYLSLIIDEMVNLKDFVSEDKGLTVRVMSFAYKKGIPHDPSGNGGGFVFDCRALNNPGKYDKYKAFTGLDQNVIDFLKKESTIDKWLEHVYALVDESVERYVKRSFTDLMICFGCTGGQHRSVYAAEHLAEHIHDKFNVRVELSHREQPDHERTLNPVEKQ